MPFRTYASLPPVDTPRSDGLRGYEDDFSTHLKNIHDLIRRYKVMLPDQGLRSAFLSTYPCPGLWSMYYQMTGNQIRGDQGSPWILAGNTYLGATISPEDKPFDKLGVWFEKRVNEANAEVNAALENGGDLAVAVGPDVPGLQAFYNERNGSLQGESEATKKKLVLALGPLNPFPEFLISDSKPDGHFREGERGAIFESKINDPSPKEWFGRYAAAYAIQYERDVKKDCDQIIVLDAGGERQQLSVQVHEIADDHIRQVKLNIKKLHYLIIESGGEHKPSLLGLGVPWKKFLKRPPGVPEEGPERSNCRECPHRKKCWKDGGLE